MECRWTHSPEHQYMDTATMMTYESVLTRGDIICNQNREQKSRLASRTCFDGRVLPCRCGYKPHDVRAIPCLSSLEIIIRLSQQQYLDAIANISMMAQSLLVKIHKVRSLQANRRFLSTWAVEHTRCSRCRPALAIS